jgi:hypothetical protein
MLLYLLFIKMQLQYKWSQLPSQSQSPTMQQAFFINKKNEQIIETQDKSLILGSVTFVLYMLIFIYIYGSAIYKKKFLKTNLTMSEAFMHCEKRISIVLMIMTLCSFQYFYYQQNLYSDDYRRTIIVVFTFVTLMLWLLLFFIWPKELYLHSFVALFIIILCTFVSNSVYELYKSYYKEDGLENLQVIAYLCLSLFVMMCAIGIFNVFRISKGLQYSITTKIIAFIEVVLITTFGIFIVILGTMPPLPNQGSLVCFMKPTDSNV